MIRSGRSASSKSSKPGDDKIFIKIPSEIKYIRGVSSRLLDGLAHYALSQDDIFDIRLCVEEALRNAIVHGNRSDDKRSVRMNYWVKDGILNIEIEDEGGGFNPGSLPDPTAEDNILKNSGRGVYLIKKLMDEMEYNESGNMIRMKKSLKVYNQKENRHAGEDRNQK